MATYPIFQLEECWCKKKARTTSLAAGGEFLLQEEQ
jgi:hypothetical protein